MKRWLPFPALSVTLLLAWLLLAGSVEPVQLLLGGALAIAVPRFARPLLPGEPARPRRPAVAARLFRIAMVEIVRSTFNVCQIGRASCRERV